MFREQVSAKLCSGGTSSRFPGYRSDGELVPASGNLCIVHQDQDQLKTGSLPAACSPRVLKTVLNHGEGIVLAQECHHIFVRTGRRAQIPLGPTKCGLSQT